MDFDTAYQFVLRQTLDPTDDLPDTFVACLRQGKPPIPGQVTSLLLALKVLYEGLKAEPALERSLVQALFALSYESRQLYNQGTKRGVDWPPLLDDDLTRLGKAAQSIILGQWQSP
ncbi:MAG: Dethiobiotin synthetase [Leptolyngbyaceae cyanobacterium SM2_5_2]|nr:Dethiobiotin synthetase [Leptolyngbyaceae cyanobacterium SM2_5_2]